MSSDYSLITRRDFIRGTAAAAVAATVGLKGLSAAEPGEVEKKTKVILIRDQELLDKSGKVRAKRIRRMLDDAVIELFGTKDAASAWKQIISPDDIVGIKTNVWGPLPTPAEVEEALKAGVLSAGVKPENIDISDRGVLRSEIFKKATALINVRPLRTHHWSGVGGLIKNYIMFTPRPPDYHDNSCADLAKVWELPLAKGKTRLNVLLMITPLFHGVGPHHFDSTYTWPYLGMLVGTDPVALDSTGLRILQAKRDEFFEEERPLKPPAHHIAFADIRHHLGTADPAKIELVRMGWQEGSLI
jgi:hypothetical protein